MYTANVFVEEPQVVTQVRQFRRDFGLPVSDFRPNDYSGFFPDEWNNYPVIFTVYNWLNESGHVRTL